MAIDEQAEVKKREDGGEKDVEEGVGEEEKAAGYESDEEGGEKESDMEEKEGGDVSDEEEEEKSAKKKRKRKGSEEKVEEDQEEGEEEKEAEPEKQDVARTPNERPTRERKTVERYSAPSSLLKSPAPKSLTIAKGSGTLLKDIPNVAYKLSKRKPDDNLQLLHTILYGKRAKAHKLKKDIGLFSGFVWIENEEKQRAKTKEKFDKCVKEKLLDFCDVLNIPAIKSSSKKEDLSAKLVEFLQSPHATTDVLLAEKQKKKGKKRKSKAAPSRSSSSKKSSAEKSAKKAKVGEKQKKAPKVEDEESEEEDKDDASDAKDESMEEDIDKKTVKEESEEDEIISEEKDESAEQTPSPKPKKSVSKGNKTPTDIKKNSSSKPSKGEDSPSPLEVKFPKTKKQKIENKSKEDKSANKKVSTAKQSGKTRLKPAKEEGKGKASKKGPSRKELYDVVDTMLKEVDFNTVTLSDILRKLGTHFGVNLIPRKAEVKEIITEVMNDMSSDDEDEVEEEGGDDAKEDSSAESDKADDDEDDDA